MNIDFTISQKEKFEIYFNELIEYNKIVNLTAITEREEVYVKHFLDSCLAQEFIPVNARLVDIGTGAGFPGVPLKIIRNDLDVILVDSLNKRINFLNQLKQKLNIEYTAMHSRAEELCKAERESFDVCVSRAVSKLNTLCEYCLPLIKVGGILIAYKGSSVQDEIDQSSNALKILGGEIREVKKFNLPNNMGERNLVIIQKINKTPNKYPRERNLPKINPII